jgi:hypothetical protein
LSQRRIHSLLWADGTSGGRLRNLALIITVEGQAEGAWDRDGSEERSSGTWTRKPKVETLTSIAIVK